MTKRMVLLGALLTACVGCGSDNRENLIGHSLGLLKQTTSKVASVRERIEEAMQKKDKGLDVKEALRAVDDLKSKGKEFQATSQAIRAMREPPTAQERKDYLAKHRDEIEREVLKLKTETDLLNQKYRELEKMAQDTAARPEVEELGKKLKEAQGEFESLARQQS